MTKLVKTGRPATPIEGTGGATLIEIGQWYWTTYKYSTETRRALMCVTHVGSNYAELESVGGYSIRQHFETFHENCEREPNAASVIRENITRHRAEAQRLMGEVKDVTARLAVTPRQTLGGEDGGETEALAVSVGAEPVDAYKTALVLAKKETLPKLFEQIKKENEAMARWMKSELIALEAESDALKPALEAINDRILSVSLYAGLSEEVVEITSGAPAAIAEPVHLFQRRHYMDEECLANYESGGMTFNDLGAFDRWLARVDNRDRLLPKPRCVVAFRVRRYEKERNDISLSQWIHLTLSGEKDLDKKTFLYMRNGDRVYRLTTEMEFGSKLFPDVERTALSSTQTLYAKRDYGRIERLATEGEYQAMVKEHEDELAEYARWEKLPKAKRDKNYMSMPWGRDAENWHKWSPESVYYDDITQYVAAQVQQHNRLVTVLQGLLDRSPVFHPHPPYQLWTADGFSAALRLVYDDGKALVSGPPPDFEAFRFRLNKSLRAGSITTGQDDYWQRAEAKKYNAAMHANWRVRDHRDVERHKPYGNPGPGMVARATQYRGGRCRYGWFREPQQYRRYQSENIKAVVWVPSSELLNVDAYTPGDFKQFYADPRTRADYLRWAPLLLEAEEYHAGNREVK